MVEGGWRDVCSGVLLAEMGAPKSRLMKVKEESEKGEKEGKGKKERGRERAERREGGKGQKGEREGGRERLHLDSPSGTGHRRRIFSALCFDLQIHVSTSPWGREGGKFFLNVQQSLHPERALQGSPHPPPQPNTENSLTPNLHGIISDYT